MFFYPSEPLLKILLLPDMSLLPFLLANPDVTFSVALSLTAPEGSVLEYSILIFLDYISDFPKVKGAKFYILCST